MFTDPAARAAHVHQCSWLIVGILGCLTLAGAAAGAAVALVHDLFIGRAETA